MLIRSMNEPRAAQVVVSERILSASAVVVVVGTMLLLLLLLLLLLPLSLSTEDIERRLWTVL